MSHIKGKGKSPAQTCRITTVLFMAASCALGCAKDPPRMTTTGSVDAAGDISSGSDIHGGADVVLDVVLIDRRPDIPPDSQPTPPADVMFPAPPQVSCAAVSDCEFPPSACAAPSCDGGGCPGSEWVVYYDNPQCLAGKCAFEQRYFQCIGGLTTCSLGGCRFNGTAAAAP